MGAKNSMLFGVPIGSAVMNPTSIHEDAGLIPWPCSVGWGSSIAVSCGVGGRCSSDPMLLWPWLWCRLAATASIWPLAWEPPFAASVALKDQKKRSPFLRNSCTGGLLRAYPAPCPSLTHLSNYSNDALINLQAEFCYYQRLTISVS